MNVARKGGKHPKYLHEVHTVKCGRYGARAKHVHPSRLLRYVGVSAGEAGTHKPPLRHGGPSSGKKHKVVRQNGQPKRSNINNVSR